VEHHRANRQRIALGVTGVFIALGVMFLAGIPASRAKMRAGS
jgi:hypothetical protein